MNNPHTKNDENVSPSNHLIEATSDAIIQQSDLRRLHLWIIHLRHATLCRRSEGKCVNPNCYNTKKLCRHILSCKEKRGCSPRCIVSKRLLSHCIRCSDDNNEKNCLVCGPVNEEIEREDYYYDEQEESLVFDNFNLLNELMKKACIS